MRISHLPRPAAMLVGFFLLASLLLPLPFAVLQPGAGKDVLRSVIKIPDQKSYNSTGKLLLTTVYVTSPSSLLFGADVLRSWIKGDSIVLPRSVIYPDHVSSKEINSANTAEMVNSQQAAAAAALTYLGYSVSQRTVTDSTGKKSIKYDLPFRVSIALKDTGGPSGGLIFALGIVEKLTPDDLLRGRTVAGTGTIDKAGHIGAIGGIEEKIIAAKRAGATIFLAPSENCGEVTHRPVGITIYSVATLKEAISVLRNPSAAIPHCTWQRNR